MPFSTFDQVKTEAGQRKQTLAPLHREMAIDEDFEHAGAVWNDGALYQYMNGLPAEAHLKIISLAKDLVDTGVNQYIIGENINVRVLLPPSAHRDSKEAEGHAKRLEEAFSALLWNVETNATETPLHTAAQHQLGLGLTCVGYPLIWDKVKRHPMKLKNGKYRKPMEEWSAREQVAVDEWDRGRFLTIPFEITPVHPRTALFDIHHDPPQDVIIETKVIPSAYIDKYPQLANFNSRAKTAVLRMYCSPENYGLWLNDAPILTKADGANSDGIAKNRTGILWYRFARSGWGSKGYGNEWEYQIQGIIRGMRAAIIAKIMDFNIADVIRTVYGLPPVGIEGDTDEEAQEAAARFVFGMAQIWWHKTGVRQHKIEVPEIPSVVIDQMKMVDGLIELHTWPEALRGLPQPGEPATSAQQRLSQGKAGLRLPKRNLEQLVEGMCMDIAYMVKHELQEPVTLLSRSMGMVTLHPDDIISGMRIIVDLAPATSEERAFERREQLVLLDKGLRSKITILKSDPDVTDPEEEYAQALSDTAMGGEIIAQAIAQEAVQAVLPPMPAAPAASVNGTAALRATSEMTPTRNQNPELPAIAR